MADLARIKENVSKMVSMDAPEGDIDNYIASEGVSIKDIKNYQPQPVSQPTLSSNLMGIGSGMLDIVKGATRPIVETSAHTLQAAEGLSPILNILRGAGIVKGKPGDMTTYDVPFYGKIPPLQNIGQGIGNALQTSSLALSGNPALMGAMFSGGGAIGQNQNPLSVGLNTALGAGTGAALGYVGDILSGVKTLPKLKPTVYNDQLVTNTGKSIINKIEAQVQPLRDLYSTLTKPYANQIVDSETFTKALSVVPKSLRNDFIDEYSNGILDAKGKPQTTVGNLQRMELELKDFINQPKYGDKLKAQDYNTAEAAKALKEIRLSQLPADTKISIKALDTKFGKVIEKSDYLLPKLAKKGGVINTKYIYQMFNNPSEAGTRTFLRDLKEIGIDLTPEIKNIQGWVARQGLKKLGRRTIDRGIEGAVIGGVLRGGH